MNGMFGGAYAFNQPIGGWDVREVWNFEYMLGYARSFNQNLGQWTFEPGLGSWEPGFPKTDGMLCGADALQKSNAPWANAYTYHWPPRR